jgi:hypothetical protein
LAAALAYRSLDAALAPGAGAGAAAVMDVA